MSYVVVSLLLQWSIDDDSPFGLAKTVFRDFWSYRPQNKSIWSKIWRWSWFWRPFGCSSSRTSPNSWTNDFRDQKNLIFSESIFRRFGNNRQTSWETGILTASSSRNLNEIEFFTWNYTKSFAIARLATSCVVVSLQYCVHLLCHEKDTLEIEIEQVIIINAVMACLRLVTLKSHLFWFCFSNFGWLPSVVGG